MALGAPIVSVIVVGLALEGRSSGLLKMKWRLRWALNPERDAKNKSSFIEKGPHLRADSFTDIVPRPAARILSSLRTPPR